MNPLNPNGKLEQKGTEDEGEKVLRLSVGEGEHYQAEGVADEQSQEIFQGFHILTGGLGERLYSFFDKAGDCLHSLSC